MEYIILIIIAFGAPFVMLGIGWAIMEFWGWIFGRVFKMDDPVYMVVCATVGTILAVYVALS